MFGGMDPEGCSGGPIRAQWLESEATSPDGTVDGLDRKGRGWIGCSGSGWEQAGFSCKRGELQVWFFLMLGVYECRASPMPNQNNANALVFYQTSCDAGGTTAERKKSWHPGKARYLCWPWRKKLWEMNDLDGRVLRGGWWFCLVISPDRLQYAQSPKVRWWRS